MLLVTSLASGLLSAYGVDGSQQVEAAMADFVSSAPGSQIVLLDDAAAMAPFGGAVSAPNPPSLAASLGRVVSSTGADAVLIVGGHEIFPFYSILNPVVNPIDPDTAVLTDNPYGANGSPAVADWLNPAIPVGRVCAGPGDSADAFCAILEGLAANRLNRSPRAGYIEITNRDWQDASFSVISEMPAPGHLFISPDDAITPANSEDLDAHFLYCNLHGFTGDPAWKGYDDVRRVFVPALSADSFLPAAVSGSVIYTEACYGLETAGRPISGSCALSALAAGAAGIVGASNLAFGSLPGPSPNLIDADAFARAFFQAALQPNATLGDCLRAARSSFLASSGPSPDPFAVKTLLQFQLLGDPTFVA